jgi:hypothetical protein
MMSIAIIICLFTCSHYLTGFRNETVQQYDVIWPFRFSPQPEPHFVKNSRAICEVSTLLLWSNISCRVLALGRQAVADLGAVGGCWTLTLDRSKDTKSTKTRSSPAAGLVSSELVS